MSMELPKTIAAYVEAYNARDVKSAVACFSGDAVVHDEGKVHRGLKTIGEWMDATIGEYDPRLGPTNVELGDPETVVTITVSGSFPGSPVSLPFRFSIENGRIASLRIES